MNASQVIRFANKVVELCCHFGKSVKLSVPKIKVVGSQSAGKSTLIKRLIEYDVLPMGENMVTRTPIHVRLHQIEQSDVTIRLSYLNENSIDEVFSVTFTDGARDSILKQTEFKQEVIKLTDLITKGKYNISRIPIFVDISSSRVINFSFVDLPGLIISTSTDKGQPRDLRNQIDTLVKQELLENNTIAMVVVRSGIDLVTDLGIGLVNEVRGFVTSETKFNTVGVLTKPDLLDAKLRSDLNFTVAGKVTNSDEPLSRVETMSEGYFVVNNNVDSVQAEEKYFMDNFDATGQIITEKRYCVSNLRQHLQTHLVNSIVDMMPIIKSNLNEILNNQRMRANQLGYEMESESEKMNYVISTISELSRLIRDAIRDDNSSQFSIGPKIRVSQEVFLRQITNLDPFSFEKTSDAELKTIIESFNGYNVASNVTIGKLIDRCVQTKRPVMLIKPHSEEFIRAVCTTLSNTIDLVLTKSSSIGSLQSYPKFKNLLFTTITKNIKQCEDAANKYINETLEIEESFMWSTSKEFREALNKHYLPRSNEEEKKQEKQSTGFKTTSAIQSSATYKAAIDNSQVFQYSYEPCQVRELATKYYSTIIERMRDTIIKVVINKIINELSIKITEQLNCLIHPPSGEQQSATSYVVENPSVAKERQILKDNIAKIESAIRAATKYEI